MRTGVEGVLNLVFIVVDVVAGCWRWSLARWMEGEGLKDDAVLEKGKAGRMDEEIKEDTS